MRPLEGTSEKAMMIDGRFETQRVSKSPLATADGRIFDSSAAPWSEIHIIAPTPGTCPICATKHDAQAPHDKESLYYVNQFYRENRRLPSWEDAMSHCAETVKAEYRAKLKKRGVFIPPSSDE